MAGCIRCVWGKGKGALSSAPVGPLNLITATLFLPEGASERRLQKRLHRLETSLFRRGIRRVVLPEEGLCEGKLERLRPVEVLPFYRGIADVLAVEWLESRGIPVPQGRVALTAPRLCPELRRAAERLCPRVRELVIRVPEGGEYYARLLHRQYGLPVTPCSTPAEVTVAFGPAEGAENVLPLYGAGPKVSLSAEGLELPEDCAGPILALLWETGWLNRERLHVTFSGQTLANGGRMCYNN